jgi:hypothetical protein
MKNSNFWLPIFAVLLQLHLSSAQEVTGRFYLDENAIDVRIENENRKAVILEGLHKSLLGAKFFSSKGDEIAIEREDLSMPKSFQHWTRLLGASPDGGNPGSIHRLLLKGLSVPEGKKAQITYLIFKAKVRTVEADRRLTLGKEMEVRLEKKEGQVKRIDAPEVTK